MWLCTLNAQEEGALRHYLLQAEDPGQAILAAVAQLSAEHGARSGLQTAGESQYSMGQHFVLSYTG